MTTIHKSKIVATLLAAALGGSGWHRFYLFGRRDLWAWVHFASLPLSALALFAGSNIAPAFSMFLFGPLILSALAGALEALVLGLTPDVNWDTKYNPSSLHASDSNWLLAVLLILTLAGGMGGLIFVISRTFDLILTGGAYG